MRRSERILLWLVIALGVVLRFTDLLVPDVSTDEAQFLLGGVSNGHPGPSMWILRGALLLFGPHLLAARIVTAVAGVLCLLPLYGIARRFLDRHGALLVTAIGSIVPSAIIFSRIAYLDSFLCLGWLTMTLCFLWTTEKITPGRLFLLFLTCLLASFAKTQGFLLIFLFCAGRIIQLRGRVGKDPVFAILILSAIPVLLAIVTHLEILANILGNSGKGMFGLAPLRLLAMFQTWWYVSWLFLIPIILSVVTLRCLPWPVWMLLLVSSSLGFFFGPTHAYYTAYLIAFALPVGVLLLRFHPTVRMGSVAVLALVTLLLLGPRDLIPHRFLFDWYREPGYWNTHADAINGKLKGASQVTILGDAGHQVRWYLEPKVIVGKDMDSSEIHGMVLLLDKAEQASMLDAKTVYEDERVMIVEKK